MDDYGLDRAWGWLQNIWSFWEMKSSRLYFVASTCF